MSESDVVILVEGLGKKYSLHHEQSERTTVLRRRARGLLKPERRVLIAESCVLRD